MGDLNLLAVERELTRWENKWDNKRLTLFDIHEMKPTLGLFGLGFKHLTRAEVSIS